MLRDYSSHTFIICFISEDETGIRSKERTPVLFLNRRIRKLKMLFLKVWRLKRYFCFYSYYWIFFLLNGSSYKRRLLCKRCDSKAKENYFYFRICHSIVLEKHTTGDNGEPARLFFTNRILKHVFLFIPLITSRKRIHLNKFNKLQTVFNATCCWN